MPVLLAMLRDECSRPRLTENAEIWGPELTAEAMAAIDLIDDYYPPDPTVSSAEA